MEETVHILPADEWGRRYLWVVSEERFKLMSAPDAREHLANGSATLRNPEGKHAVPIPAKRGSSRRPDEEVPYKLSGSI